MRGLHHAERYRTTRCFSLKIDDEAVEIVKEHDDFRETKTERLFLINPISEDNTAYYLDLRGGNWTTYGYKGDEQIELPEMKSSCLKKVKSRIRGRNSSTLDNFA